MKSFKTFGFALSIIFVGNISPIFGEDVLSQSLISNLSHLKSIVLTVDIETSPTVKLGVVDKSHIEKTVKKELKAIGIKVKSVKEKGTDKHPVIFAVNVSVLKYPLNPESELFFGSLEVTMGESGKLGRHPEQETIVYSWKTAPEPFAVPTESEVKKIIDVFLEKALESFAKDYQLGNPKN